jgi:nucleotide-binding universal stress UspA family protein
MFQSILIPIDHYAPHTDAAVAAAVDLAKLTGAAIHVVHAEEGISGIDSLALGPLPADTASKMRQEDIDLLEDVRQRFADVGLSATTELLPRDGSSIHKRVLVVAERVGADLIVLGAGGNSELVGLLLGSVSHKIIQHAPSAVLVIK